jgi:hypothetical protein
MISVLRCATMLVVVVIGAEGRGIAAENARSHVAGLTVGQDISERMLQRIGPAPQFSLVPEDRNGRSLPRFMEGLPNPGAQRCSPCLAGESRLKQHRMKTVGLPEIRNASDKPSNNDPRLRQTERDVPRQQ